VSRDDTRRSLADGADYRLSLDRFALPCCYRSAVAANAFWGDVFTKKSTIPMTQSISILTGCAAGATESFLVTPFELVKIRLQDKASTFTGPLDVIKKTLARSGPLGLYVGMEATFWRHVSWNGGYFGSIFQIRSLLPKAEVGSRVVSLFRLDR
jgi:hypothetical protein